MDQREQEPSLNEGMVNKEDRQRLNKHKSIILWFTGLSGSGKSTISRRVEEELYKLEIRTYVLDGDNIREGLNRDLGFSAEDRKENIRRVGEIAKLFVDAGVVVITAFISPYAEDRRFVRSLVEKNEFIEIYAKCSPKVCEERDIKGLYKKARLGVIKQFTGIDDPYEEPERPEIVVETDKMGIEECVGKIMGYLEERKLRG